MIETIILITVSLVVLLAGPVITIVLAIRRHDSYRHGHTFPLEDEPPTRSTPSSRLTRHEHQERVHCSFSLSLPLSRTEDDTRAIHGTPSEGIWLVPKGRTPTDAREAELSRRLDGLIRGRAIEAFGLRPNELSVRTPTHATAPSPAEPWEPYEEVVSFASSAVALIDPDEIPWMELLAGYVCDSAIPTLTRVCAARVLFDAAPKSEATERILAQFHALDTRSQFVLALAHRAPTPRIPGRTRCDLLRQRLDSSDPIIARDCVEVLAMHHRAELFTDGTLPPNVRVFMADWTELRASGVTDDACAAALLSIALGDVEACVDAFERLRETGWTPNDDALLTLTRRGPVEMCARIASLVRTSGAAGHELVAALEVRGQLVETTRTTGDLGRLSLAEGTAPGGLSAASIEAGALDIHDATRND